ncbi:MAG TPA: serine/threonine-protein kinase, partial [Polyangiaceae bacterium]
MVEAIMPSCPLAVGDLVQGKYQIDAVLGEGGMGIVFAATHVELHCPVAIKVIRQELSQEPELVARLMLEARAAAQIKSEHVCRVLDVGRLDSGAPFVVMEYLRGRNLGFVLRSKGRFPERVAVDYLLQACEAIAEAHRAGVIHRDLKPENLFLAEFPDGHRAIKVLDFGISKTAGTFVKAVGRNLTNPSSAMGSPHYMAPEQMSAASDVDIRADIWALGTILYELLTGHLAFEGDSLPIVCAAVLQSQPKPIRNHTLEISTELEATIFACLTKDREQRPRSVADLAQRVAPYGSPQAAESVARISKLLEDSSTGIHVEMDDPSGTMFSPRASGTPRDVIAPREGVARTPVETPAGVSSTKESESFPNAAARRYRWPTLVAALGLGGALFIAWSMHSSVGAFSATRPFPTASAPSVPRSSFGVAASPLAPVPGPTLVLEPVDSANLVPNAPSA